MNRPHIVILMTDQQRGDCLSCAGHPVLRTPHLDRIAAEGTRFASAYTSSPVCMPARSSFLSGLYCHNHGQWGNYGHLPKDADTYLRHLKRAGYHTCHVGKSHLFSHQPGSDMRDYDPLMHAFGFDEVFETGGPWATVEAESIATNHWRRLGCYQALLDDYARRRQIGALHALWPSVLPEGETLDDFVARTATDYIEGYDRAEPLLLFVGFGSPHEPWDPPASWAERYDPADMPPAQPPGEPGPWVPPKAAQAQRPPHPALTPEQIALVRARYFAKIAHVDSLVGDILAALERRGWLNSTALVFWSDHGEMLGDHGRFHKGVFYEQAVRVPLLLRLPRHPRPGGVVASPVEITDVFPTLLAIAGCPPKPSAPGRSLLPLCDEPSGALHDAVFSEIGKTTMVRTERHKLVVDSAGDSLMLYDLEADPQETTNLLGQADVAPIHAALRDRLLRWHLATQVTWKQMRGEG